MALGTAPIVLLDSIYMDVFLGSLEWPLLIVQDPADGRAGTDPGGNTAKLAIEEGSESYLVAITHDSGKRHRGDRRLRHRAGDVVGRA